LGSRTGFSADDPRLTEARRARGTLREYAETILICVVVFVFLRAFVLQPSEIPSGSMEDTVLPGDYILVDRFSYAPTSFAWEARLVPRGPVKRGDLVVFKHPVEPERDYIKRVIGLPGDTLEIRDGFVWINGRPIDEPYLDPLYRSREFRPAEQVPEDRYFLMGDHRCDSSDSRSWGTVPQELIKGRAFLILFSTAAPPPESDPGKVTVVSTLRKLWYIVFRSRWDRALRPIR
jgi:signal peptidase I